MSCSALATDTHSRLLSVRPFKDCNAINNKPECVTNINIKYRITSRGDIERSCGTMGGGTSAWNTPGETASLKNACAQYGLTEEQVREADPPISCQW